MLALLPRVCDTPPPHCCPPPRPQNRTDCFDAEGQNIKTAADVDRGKKYAQCLLDELELGKFEAWIDGLAHKEERHMRLALNPLFVQLAHKIQHGEQWTNLPDDAQGGPTRDIATTAPKLIGMAVTRAIDTVRKNGPTGELLPDHFVRSFAPFKSAIDQLKKKTADAHAAAGNEAKQRRERTLYDHEQMALFESILSCGYATSQKAGGTKDAACRNPMDTLTLGVIVALHFALGQRGINVLGALLDLVSLPSLSLTRGFSTRLSRSSTTSSGATWR